MAEVAFTSFQRAIASEFEYHESLFKVRILKPFGERNVAAIFSLSLTVNREQRHLIGIALVSPGYKAEIVAADRSLWRRHQDVQLRRHGGGRS
jgi:hypothetical protein